MNCAEGTGEAYREWLESRTRSGTLEEVAEAKRERTSEEFDEWLNNESAYAKGRKDKAHDNMADRMYRSDS